MILFIIALVTGYIAMNVAAALGANDTLAVIITLMGFTLPYSFVLEQLYKNNKKK